MKRKYDIVLYGQLGPRYGMLSWTENGSRITGTLSLLGFENPVIGHRDGQRLTLSHKMRTMVSVLTCHTSAELRGGVLCGVVSSGYCRMSLHGKKSTERLRKRCGVRIAPAAE